MNYRILTVNDKERWIFIAHDDWDEPDGMMMLIKSIQEEIGGSIINIEKDDDIYAITNDKFKLKFQWDSCFGTVVIFNKISDKDEVINMLERHFRVLNEDDKND